MTEERIPRQKAIMWWAGLLVVSVLGTGIIMWYKGDLVRNLVVGVALFAAVFGCGSVLGMRANPAMIGKDLTDGLRTLIQPAPRWVAAVLVLELLVFVLLGWPWFWRTTLPLPAGIVAGYKWARQPQPTQPRPDKPQDEEPPPIDIWKV